MIFLSLFLNFFLTGPIFIQILPNKPQKASPIREGSDCRKSFLLPRRRKAVLGVLIRRTEDLRKAGGFLRTKSSETGRAVSVHALPHGIANSFRQTIPRMVCLRCLLTSLGERFAFPVLRGPAPAPPQPFEKGWRKLYVLPAVGTLRNPDLHRGSLIFHTFHR